MKRLFILSPADCGGRRAQLVLRPEAAFPLAVRLRRRGVPAGELFSFLSGLYFRGKLAYARTSARPPRGCRGAYVITTCRGLIAAAQRVTRDEVLELACGDIDPADPAYREPLERDARALAARCGPKCQVVLLGSVATGKYTEILLAAFGERLVFPAEFVGRGDMSRGGLLLRAAAEGRELACIPVAGAIVRGKRPPRLPRLAPGEEKTA